MVHRFRPSRMPCGVISLSVIFRRGVKALKPSHMMSDFRRRPISTGPFSAGPEARRAHTAGCKCRVPDLSLLDNDLSLHEMVPSGQDRHIFSVEKRSFRKFCPQQLIIPLIHGFPVVAPSENDRRERIRQCQTNSTPYSKPHATTPSR